MKKLNLYEMYLFGKQLAPVSNITPEAKVAAWSFNLWIIRAALSMWIADESPLLNTSRRAVNKMIDAINSVVPQDIMGLSKIEDEKVFNWSAAQITGAFGELEHVLGNDMPDIAAYIVSQKGIYRTDDLIAHADHQLTADIRAILPAQASFDLREAGKCLAYELATACTFHLWRGVETVMEEYHQVLAGKTFDQAGVQRNWGAYIKALEKAKAPTKITVFLDHIRDEYRNPQTHPDAQITIDEAQRLFGVAMSSIDQMMVDIQKHPVAVSASDKVDSTGVPVASTWAASFAPPP